MKPSDLKEFIREEIIEILSEEETADEIKAKTAAQAELNKELEKTKELTTESLNPEVIKAVDRFIKAMAKRYGYGEQDAVFAIQAALKQREFDRPADIPGFEGTMDDLDSLSIREEEEPTDAELRKSSSIAKTASKLADTAKEMKTVVNQYKKAEGAEKESLLKRLKELTKIKKELEGLL